MKASSFTVITDKRSGIVSDPNRPDGPQYILRIIGKVISVSLETVEIVEKLPALGIEESEPVEDASRVSQAAAGRRDPAFAPEYTLAGCSILGAHFTK